MKVFNPILSGFHADPSIVNVNGEIFIANSTFEWFPGVEIHRSKDMIHWDSVPSPLSEKRLLDMAGNKASCGIWAPCLSWSEGIFYLVFTNVRSWNDGPWKDTPNFITTAKSIEGPWSDPVFMNASGFDASLFHDDDGKKWFVNMEWDYRGSGARQFSGILLQEFDPVQKKLTGGVHKIFSGTDIGLVEGPHIYKRNGWYYIFAAEGGTCDEHAITCARSRTIFGPYEIHPSNPLITSYGQNCSLTRAGHGSWCVSPDGKKDYLVYLCGRPTEKNRCILGRETGLAEIEWKDDWPFVKQPDGTFGNFPPEYVEIPGSEGEIPSGGGVIHAAEKYTFSDTKFLRDFKTLRIPPDEKRFSISERKGFLRIHGGQSPLSCFMQGLLARRQTDFDFEAETKFEFSPENFQQFAGMIYRYDEQTQYICAATFHETKGKVLQVLTIMPEGFSRGMEIQLDEKNPVWIKLIVHGENGFFYWSQDGKNFRQIRPLLDASKLSDEYGGQGFTGAFVGMFCADMVSYENFADYEYFSYKKI